MEARGNSSLKPQSLAKTYAVLLFCVICWGSSLIFGAILVSVFDAIAVAFIRLLFINVFLWLYGWRFIRKKRISMKMLLILAGAGFIGLTVNQWTLYASLQYTDPVTAALLYALVPLITALITYFYLKERRKIAFWVGVFIGFSGVLFVVTSGNSLSISVGKGELLISFTVITFSIFLVIVQQLSKSIDPIAITLYTNLFGVLLFIPFIPIQSIQQSLQVDLKYWVLLISTAILMNGVCTLLWNASIQRVGAANSAMVLNVEPFVTMVVGYIVLHQAILPIQLIGSFLIITGVILGTRAGKIESLAV